MSNQVGHGKSAQNIKLDRFGELQAKAHGRFNRDFVEEAFDPQNTAKAKTMKGSNLNSNGQAQNQHIRATAKFGQTAPPVHNRKSQGGTAPTSGQKALSANRQSDRQTSPSNDLESNPFAVAGSMNERRLSGDASDQAKRRLASYGKAKTLRNQSSSPDRGDHIKDAEFSKSAYSGNSGNVQLGSYLNIPKRKSLLDNFKDHIGRKQKQQLYKFNSNIRSSANSSPGLKDSQKQIGSGVVDSGNGFTPNFKASAQMQDSPEKTLAQSMPGGLSSGQWRSPFNKLTGINETDRENHTPPGNKQRQSARAKTSSFNQGGKQKKLKRSRSVNAIKAQKSIKLNKEHKIDKRDLEEFQTRSQDDYGLKKFKDRRSQTVVYVQQPAQGNLSLYMKSTRMNRVPWTKSADRKKKASVSKSQDQLFSQVLRRGQTAHMVDAQKNTPGKSITASRYLEHHDKKIMRLLGHEEKQNTLSKYLRMKNKLGLNYLKPEIDGLAAEKEQALLVKQDMKKKLIYDSEELTIMRMQNDEYRRLIAQMQQDTEEIKEKQVRCQFTIDGTCQSLFSANDTMKLIQQTIYDLQRAGTTEKAQLKTLQKQIKEMRQLLHQETIQRDEIKNYNMLMRKKIESLNTKHEIARGELDHGLLLMNDQLDEMVDKGYVSVKQLERNTRNLVAASESKFYMSKYTASKVFSSKMDKSHRASEIQSPTAGRGSIRSKSTEKGRKNTVKRSPKNIQ